MKGKKVHVQLRLYTSVQPHDVPGPTPFVRGGGGFQATQKLPVYTPEINLLSFQPYYHVIPVQQIQNIYVHVDR